MTTPARSHCDSINSTEQNACFGSNDQFSLSGGGGKSASVMKLLKSSQILCSEHQIMLFDFIDDLGNRSGRPVRCRSGKLLLVWQLSFRHLRD